MLQTPQTAVKYLFPIIHYLLSEPQRGVSGAGDRTRLHYGVGVVQPPPRDSPQECPIQMGSSPPRYQESRYPVWVSAFLVPLTGLEPVRSRLQRILSPRCLPFHHSGGYPGIIAQILPTVNPGAQLTMLTSCSVTRGKRRSSPASRFSRCMSTPVMRWLV